MASQSSSFMRYNYYRHYLRGDTNTTNIRKIPAGACSMASQAQSAVPGGNPYERLNSLTLLEHHAIKANKTCLLPKAQQCLQEIYPRVSYTGHNQSLDHRSKISIASRSNSTKDQNIDFKDPQNMVVFIVICFLVATFCWGICIGLSAFVKWRLFGNHRNRHRNDGPAPTSRRVGFWRSCTNPKPAPEFGSHRTSRDTRSTRRGASGRTSHRMHRDDTPVILEPVVRREPSAFDGEEGLPWPPPAYEAEDTDTWYEDRERARYLWHI